MKSITLTILFIISSQFIYAQEMENPHSFVLGGSINFTSQTNAYPFSLASIPYGGFFRNGRDDTK